MQITFQHHRLRTELIIGGGVLVSCYGNLHKATIVAFDHDLPKFDFLQSKNDVCVRLENQEIIWVMSTHIQPVVIDKQYMCPTCSKHMPVRIPTLEIVQPKLCETTTIHCPQCSTKHTLYVYPNSEIKIEQPLTQPKRKF